MAGILEFLVAALDRVAAGGGGADHGDDGQGDLANHSTVFCVLWTNPELQAHLEPPSHLSLPYEEITVCCDL